MRISLRLFDVLVLLQVKLERSLLDHWGQHRAEMVPDLVNPRPRAILLRSSSVVVALLGFVHDFISVNLVVIRVKIKAQHSRERLGEISLQLWQIIAEESVRVRLAIPSRGSCCPPRFWFLFGGNVRSWWRK